MKKRGKVQEIDTKVEIVEKNIVSLKNKMTDKDRKKKYKYHLKKLQQAKKRIFAMAQMPMSKDIPQK